ncbi:MAG: helix-turn-helix domain-containing protein [Oscillospiraceae bacterium]|nr:helix-turn-helix domain-containing protein [Oscillospiraceae bacterium]
MDQKRIGSFISELRKEKNMTQKDLAEKLGITDRAISKWENGRGMPEVSLMKPLCEALDISINELLSGERIEQKDYREKSEFNFLNTMDYTQKKIKKNTLFRKLVIAFLVIALLTVLLLMDARVITRRYFSPKSDLDFFSVVKTLPVAPQGAEISMDTVHEFVDQDITEKIDRETLEELLPLMQVSIFPIFSGSHWMGDEVYEIHGYIQRGPGKGKHFIIGLGLEDVHYVQGHGNRRYYIKDTGTWIKLMEMLEGWEGESREHFSWEGQTLSIFYDGTLYSGPGYLCELPDSAAWLGGISNISEHPDQELECSFSDQGMNIYQWAEGGTDYIGVQVSYYQAFAIPMK